MKARMRRRWGMVGGAAAFALVTALLPDPTALPGAISAADDASRYFGTAAEVAARRPVAGSPFLDPLAALESAIHERVGESESASGGTAQATGPVFGGLGATRGSVAAAASRTGLLSPAPRLGRGGWFRSGASWYGPGFYGNRTACGQRYSTEILGVAHRTLPCGTKVQFRWKGQVVTVRVIDRGPYGVAGRDWDLSGGLCKLLRRCYTAPIDWRIVR